MQVHGRCSEPKALEDALIYFFGYSLEGGQWVLTWTNEVGESKARQPRSMP